MLYFISIFFIFAFIIEIIFMPRIDITREKDVLLWYGKKHRKFINLIKIK